jgi:hypothetical protein
LKTLTFFHPPPPLARQKNSSIVSKTDPLSNPNEARHQKGLFPPMRNFQSPANPQRSIDPQAPSSETWMQKRARRPSFGRPAYINKVSDKKAVAAVKLPPISVQGAAWKVPLPTNTPSLAVQGAMASLNETAQLVPQERVGSVKDMPEPEREAVMEVLTRVSPFKYLPRSVRAEVLQEAKYAVRPQRPNCVALFCTTRGILTGLTLSRLIHARFTNQESGSSGEETKETKFIFSSVARSASPHRSGLRRKPSCSCGFLLTPGQDGQRHHDIHREHPCRVR